MDWWNIVVIQRLFHQVISYIRVVYHIIMKLPQNVRFRNWFWHNIRISNCISFCIKALSLVVITEATASESWKCSFLNLRSKQLLIFHSFQCYEIVFQFLTKYYFESATFIRYRIIIYCVYRIMRIIMLHIEYKLSPISLVTNSANHKRFTISFNILNFSYVIICRDTGHFDRTG